MSVNLGTVGFIVFIFGIIGVAMLFAYFQSKKKVEKSQSWSAVQGYISKSYLRSETDTDSDGVRSTSYFLEVLYTYEFLGQEYTGDKISFSGKPGSSNYKKAENLLAQYPVGQGVTVYYDPNNPEDAVLVRKALGKAMLIIGVVFILIALSLLCYAGIILLKSLMG